MRLEIVGFRDLGFIKHVTAGPCGCCMVGDRTYLCMGVVKLEDHVPNWDLKAMEEAKP